MTSMRAKSTGNNSGKSVKPTSEQLMLMPYQNTIYSLRDFLARVSQLLATEGDMRIQGEHSFLKYAESHGLKSPTIYSLRMSGDSSHMMMGIPLKPLSERWMNWGMTVNGECLTASISARAKDHASLSLRYFGTTKIMQGKGISKPFRFLLTSARGFDMRTLMNRKIGEVPSELYENMQGFPIGWTRGIASTRRKKCLGNAVTVNVIEFIGKQLLATTNKEKEDGN